MASRQAFMGFQGMMLPPVRRVRMAGPGNLHRRMSGTGQPPPAGICCQATRDGGAICSEGTGFSPTCPKKPNPNVPGVAEYRQVGNLLYPIPPSPQSCQGGTAGPSSPPPAPSTQQNFAAGSCPLAAAMATPGGLAPAGPYPVQPTAAQYPAVQPTAVNRTAPIPAPPPPPAMPSQDSDVGTLAAVGGLGALIYYLVG